MSYATRVYQSEREIEDYLFLNPGEIRLDWANPMIYVKKWIGRQFKVPSGIIDLLGEMSDGTVAVVELKKGKIEASAIAQVCRYAQDIESALIWGLAPFYCPPITVHKFVVGDSISEKAKYECSAMRVTSLNMLFEESPLTQDEQCDLWGIYAELSKTEDLKRIHTDWLSAHRKEAARKAEQDNARNVFAQLVRAGGER